MQVTSRLRGVKYFLRLTILFALLLSVSTVKAAPENEAGVVVLNYHKIDRMNIPLSVSPEEFDQQMSYFKTYNFNVIGLDRLYDYLEKGEPLPKKSVVITFDDGYSDNYDNAYPILKKYGFPATIFVITSLVGKPNYITWAQAKEMSENGIGIDSHTVNHRTLSDMSSEKALNELKKSKEIIEKNVGKTVKYVAYPEGYYNKITEKLAKEAGYRGALTIRYGAVDKFSDPFALERVPIFHTQATIRDFMRRIHYSSNFAQTGWVE